MKDPLKAFGVALARVGHRHGIKTATRAPAFMARIAQEIRGLGPKRTKHAADDMASELQRWLEEQFGVQLSGEDDGSGGHERPPGSPGR